MMGNVSMDVMLSLSKRSTLATVCCTHLDSKTNWGRYCLLQRHSAPGPCPAHPWGRGCVGCRSPMTKVRAIQIRWRHYWGFFPRTMVLTSRHKHRHLSELSRVTGPLEHGSALVTDVVHSPARHYKPCCRFVMVWDMHLSRNIATFHCKLSFLSSNMPFASQCKIVPHTFWPGPSWM